MDITQKLKNYQCQVAGCIAKFTKKHQLRSHEILSHGLKSGFNCGICEKHYSQQCHLRRHMKIHEGHTCTDCNEHFSTWSLFNKHKAKVHKSDHQCCHCKKLYSSNDNLVKHIRAFHDSHKFKCTEENCNETFHKKRQLHDHNRTVHNIGLLKCTFPDCNSSFRLSEMLKSHLRKHQGYKCDDCDQVLESWSLLRKHKAVMHKKGKKTSEILASKEKFNCQVEGCYRSYTLKRNLSAHVRTFHEGQRVKCELGCEVYLTTKQKLLMHYETIHHKSRDECPRPLSTTKKISTNLNNETEAGNGAITTAAAEDGLDNHDTARDDVTAVSDEVTEALSSNSTVIDEDISIVDEVTSHVTEAVDTLDQWRFEESVYSTRRPDGVSRTVKRLKRVQT